MKMNELVTASSIEAAARLIENVVVRTPLLPAPWLSGLLGGEVRLKCENLQRAGAFKIRGAYTAIARLPDDERRRGVITYSSGNHAQGVALAAKLFGVPAVVVMPTTSPAVKREGARRLGAEVILEGTTSVERERRARAEAAARGLTIIPAFDHADIIAGQGTIGVEILEDWSDVDTIVVPVGGGGMISGVAAWVARTRPACRVIGVEPENADAMARALEAGEPVTIEARPTIADGLMPVRAGDLTFAHVRDLAHGLVRVSDAAIADATARLLATGKLVAEFSGAATVAALLSGVIPVSGRRVAAVVSGGNLDPARALELLGAGADAASAPAGAVA
ncbi:MAG: threonine ammonia-lyase [Longimicrobiales bacterium]